MSRAGKGRSRSRAKRRPRARRRRLWPSARSWRRWRKRFATAPASVQVTLVVAVLVLSWAAVNWIYQVARKPAELFFPVSGALSKSPPQTWRQYADIFRAHSTAVITPELLAALAQVEGSGNPVARTYWRWSATWDPFELYRPASSAVGMYQITDATFEAARRYCIHDHVVVDDGPWHAWRSCWFNVLYTRVVPSHAAEMTSAYLDLAVTRALARRPGVSATLEQKQDLAALIHLCGAGAADAFVRRGFELAPGQRCGDHHVGVYLGRINSMKRVFARMGGD